MFISAHEILLPNPVTYLVNTMRVPSVPSFPSLTASTFLTSRVTPQTILFVTWPRHAGYPLYSLSWRQKYNYFPWHKAAAWHRNCLLICVMCQASDRYTAFSQSSIYFLKALLANQFKAEDCIHLILQQASYTFISSLPAYNRQKKFVKYHTFFLSFIFWMMPIRSDERL